jgi:hypothetical protein
MYQHLLAALPVRQLQAAAGIPSAPALQQTLLPYKAAKSLEALSTKTAVLVADDCALRGSYVTGGGGCTPCTAAAVLLVADDCGSLVNMGAVHTSRMRAPGDIDAVAGCNAYDSIHAVWCLHTLCVYSFHVDHMCNTRAARTRQKYASYCACHCRTRHWRRRLHTVRGSCSTSCTWLWQLGQHGGCAHTTHASTRQHE